MIINQIPFFGLALALFFFDLANSSIFEKAHKQQCQPIHIDSCLDLPYNSTIAPKSNIFGDEQSLSEQVRHFNPLFKTKCSSHLKFLVCSVFAPMCPPEMPQAVTSCRSVCEEVKRDCMSILSEFDIKWPSLLNCTNFPLEPELCMKPAAAPARVTTHSTRSPIFNSRPRQNHINPIPHQLPSCPADLLNLDPTDANSKCALPCNRHFLFSQEKSEMAEHWLLTGALVNVIVTAFTFLTFMIDRDRFRFPERSVFYIALCSLTSSLPYLSRYFLTYEQTGCDRMPTGRLFLVHEGLDNTVCVLSFLFNYYFGMAGCVWWLMSTFIWYLSTARKWVQEEIEKREVYLHLVAWGLPALPSITILILQKVRNGV
ncbi:unnamed protein product [Bursaphelenchus xylophilus]|nr:unnamed protein product [Bursaphelenchus xylophilus]CAG9080622.1 unnamed protein product [Bursaphelenchus xylophilus]